MGKGVRDCAREFSPNRFRREKRCGPARGFFVELMRPVGGRHLAHAAEQALRRPCAQQERAICARDDERRAATQPSFDLWWLARKGFGIATRRGETRPVPRAEHARWLLRRTDGGAEIHQRLREITEAAWWQQRFGLLAD